MQAGGFGDARHIAADLVKGFEGCSLYAYPDPAGQSQTFSIGWGHQITGADGLSSQSTIDQPTADALLLQDLETAAQCVESSVTVGIGETQKAALISFAYNEGCGAFKSSTLLRKINVGDTVGATAEFSRWIYANGSQSAALIARRASEASLFGGPSNG